MTSLAKEKDGLRCRIKNNVITLDMDLKNAQLHDAIKLSLNPLVQLGKSKEVANLQKQLELLADTPLCLLICGEFKRGKSTFVNGLIGRQICPTDTDICTSVVSIIKYGPKEKVTRFYGDLSNSKSETISLDDLEKYTVGSAEEIGNTIYVEIELPLEPLKAGIVVVDTPGVGGLDPRHATLTNFFLPRADATLFVTDVNEPLTITELNFYKSKVLQYSKHSAVIVNKADLRDANSVEDFRQDTMKKIAAFTQCSISDVTAIAVSSAAEVYSDADLGESNFEAVRKVVSQLHQAHKREQCEILKANFIEMLDLSIEPLTTQLQQIEQPDVDQIVELNKRKSQIDAKILELTDPTSEFRIAVNKEITSRREDIVNILNEASVTLQSTTFNSIIQSPSAKGENGGKWVGRKLNDAIAEISSNITMELDRAFSDIAAMPQFEGMLHFDMKSFNQKIVVRDVCTEVPLHKRVTPMVGTAGIASVASIGLTQILGIAMGPIGWAVLLGVGAAVAYKNQSDVSAAHIESNLRQVYQPQLSGAVNSLNTYIGTRFQEFQQEWLGIITERAKTYKESLQESIANIQKVKQDINKAVTMKAQLQLKIKPLLAAKELLMEGEK